MARADAGLTISQLAERAGVSRDTISKAEKGRHNLQAGTLSKVARALEMSASELLAEEEKYIPKVPARSLESPLAREDLEAFRARVGVASPVELEGISAELQELTAQMDTPTEREDYKIVHSVAMKVAAVMLRWQRIREQERDAMRA